MLQLNNYRDLIDEIKNADEKSAEPLTREEKRIITRISRTFPQEKLVYGATHREEIWKEKTAGEIIPYSDSARMTEM